ncbi:tether containing UBX domain for GLUT4-like [Bolinopsis microptera]|uniref:tether containing UBX domain for GLUT4-like n=1 Tax=Bolinopsis microptera TaxID=2820187 RepID=UPI00307A6A80
MSSSVWVLCPNGRRVSIAFGPNSPLNSIKQQACEKQGFDPAKYGMRKEDAKKAFDLSLPFRLSGIANKAKLELFEDIQKIEVVSIALQLESGGRVMGKIANTATIAQTIQSIGKDLGAVSSLMYLQRKIGAEKFGTTTLADLGIFKGSALLRLQEVKEESSQPETASPKPLPKKDVQDVQGMETETTRPVIVEESSVSSNPSEMEVEETDFFEKVNRCMAKLTEEQTPVRMEEKRKPVSNVPILFDPSASSVEIDRMEESDDFFEFTDKDLKSMLRDLHKISEREFRFRQPEKEKILPDQVVFRIRLPNGLMLQNVFETKSSTTDSLYKFVGDYLTEDSVENLSIYQAPPKRLVKPGQTLINAGLTLTTLLHAGGDIVMRPDLTVESDPSGALGQLTDVVGKPDILNDSPNSSRHELPSPVTRLDDVQSTGSSRPRGDKPVPKWFKLK